MQSSGQLNSQYSYKHRECHSSSRCLLHTFSQTPLSGIHTEVHVKLNWNKRVCAVYCCNAITPIASFWVLIIPWTNSKSLTRAKEIFKNYSPPKHTHRRQQKKVSGADFQRCMSKLWVGLFSPLSKRADSLFFSRCLFQLHHLNSHISGAVSFWNILHKINSFAYYNLKNSIYYDILIDQK